MRLAPSPPAFIQKVLNSCKSLPLVWPGTLHTPTEFLGCQRKALTFWMIWTSSFLVLSEVPAKFHAPFSTPRSRSNRRNRMNDDSLQCRSLWSSWCRDPQSPKLETANCFALVWCSDWRSGTSTPPDTEPSVTTARFNKSTVACGVQANIFSMCLNTFSRCHQEPRKTFWKLQDYKMNF